MFGFGPHWFICNFRSFGGGFRDLFWTVLTCFSGRFRSIFRSQFRSQFHIFIGLRPLKGLINHPALCIWTSFSRRIRIRGQKLPILSTRAEQIRKTTVRDLSVWTQFFGQILGKKKLARFLAKFFDPKRYVQVY